MKRKLQIFVSSTYTDLLVERQAAVQAILRAGHIPAGMELFAAGDQSQLEVIKRWIDESDIFMLILGGRYGSVDKAKGKSYTQLEYEYAVETRKPFFALVLSEDALQRKVQTYGMDMVERVNGQSLEDFRALALSKISRLVDDEKDITIALMETVLEMTRTRNFDGWISGREVGDVEETLKNVVRLTSENAKLKEQVANLKAQVPTPAEDGSPDFAEIRENLSKTTLHFHHVEDDGMGGVFDSQSARKTPLQWLLEHRHSFIIGQGNAEPLARFLHDQVGGLLILYRLAERQDYKEGWNTSRVTLNERGLDFLRYLDTEH